MLLLFFLMSKFAGNNITWNITSYDFASILKMKLHQKLEENKLLCQPSTLNIQKKIHLKIFKCAREIIREYSIGLTLDFEVQAFNTSKPIIASRRHDFERTSRFRFSVNMYRVVFSGIQKRLPNHRKKIPYLSGFLMWYYNLPKFCTSSKPAST